jgi:hypothetical protein
MYVHVTPAYLSLELKVASRGVLLQSLKPGKKPCCAAETGAAGGGWRQEEKKALLFVNKKQQKNFCSLGLCCWPG